MTDVIKGKYMDRKNVAGSGGENWRNRLHTCPACGEPLKGGISRANHIASHDPSDFGL